jgi:hypothetical protein
MTKGTDDKDLVARLRNTDVRECEDYAAMVSDLCLEAADRIEQLSSANAELQRIIGWCRRRLSSPSLEQYVDEMLSALQSLQVGGE